MRATREQIIEAAAGSFADGGWHGATLAKVGDRLGISKSAVLYHFASKGQLLDEVLAPVAAASQEFVDGFGAPPAAHEDRMDLVSRLMTLYIAHHAACLALQNDRLLWTHGSTGLAMQGTYATLVDLLVGGRDGDARLRSHAVLSLSFRSVTTGLDLSEPVRDVASPAGLQALRICADVLGG